MFSLSINANYLVRFANYLGFEEECLSSVFTWGRSFEEIISITKLKTMRERCKLETRILVSTQRNRKMQLHNAEITDYEE